MKIDDTLVRRLIETQFPQWKDLPIQPVTHGGWDNRTFHLGEQMFVRMPSAAKYASQIKKEYTWLPKLAPLLPLQIPKPLALGQPACDYPFNWSIYRWIDGETVAYSKNLNLNQLAQDLAKFLKALHAIDPTGGPLPGPHNFYRGASLRTDDSEIRQAIKMLKEKINVDAATKVWETGLATSWQRAPVWVHGDIAAGNLLVQKGSLTAVIDFGQLGIGDPACDLTIAWTLFKDESRKTFQSMLPHIDSDTWNRARAWTLWKALIVAAGLTNTNTVEGEQAWRIIDEVLKKHEQTIPKN